MANASAPLSAALLSSTALACADECPTRVQVGHVDVCVDLALTAEERLTGLRGHAALRDDEGLLIRFPVTGEVCLVNDGVAFDIDAVLFDAAHRVSAVLTLATDDATARCAGPARDVLELRAGRAAGLQLGIQGVLP